MKKWFLWAVLCMAGVCLSSCGSDDNEYGDVNIPEMEMSELAGTWKGTITEYEGKHTYTVTLDGKGKAERIDECNGEKEKGTGSAYLTEAEDGCHVLHMTLSLELEGMACGSSTSAVHVKWANAKRTAIYMEEEYLFKKQ